MFLCVSKNSSAYDSTNNRHCFHDCCATNECLFAHFGIHMAHAVSPTTLPVSSSVENSTGLWQQLRSSCEDTFDLALCQSLKVSYQLWQCSIQLYSDFFDEWPKSLNNFFFKLCNRSLQEKKLFFMAC